MERKSTLAAAVIGAVLVVVIFVAGIIWMGNAARDDTEEAVRTVSLLYLDELAGRRETVVDNNLQHRINDIQMVIDLMSQEDLSDKAHMEAYQNRMKGLFHLERFAFVDTDGMIYTSAG